MEVRPEPVRGVRPGAGFTVDRQAGTLTWTSDVARRAPLQARLPGTVGPTGLPEVHRVTVVTVPQATADLRLLVLTDADGRCLASSGQQDRRNFDAMWPPGRIEQLGEAGLVVDRDRVRHRRELQQRYPGAARWWWLLTFPYAIAPFGLAFVALFLLLAVLLG